MGKIKNKDFDVYEKYQVDTSDYMISFDWIHDYEKTISSLPKEKTVEIIFHPELENEFEFLEKMQK